MRISEELNQSRKLSSSAKGKWFASHTTDLHREQALTKFGSVLGRTCKSGAQGVLLWTFCVSHWLRHVVFSSRRRRSRSRSPRKRSASPRRRRSSRWGSCIHTHTRTHTEREKQTRSHAHAPHRCTHTTVLAQSAFKKHMCFFVLFFDQPLF